MIKEDIDTSENLLAVLNEAQDIARCNIVKAILNVFAGFLVLALVVLADHGFLTISELVQPLSKTSYDALWAAKWILAIGSSLYIFVSLGHVYMCWYHVREGRNLLKWMKYNV